MKNVDICVLIQRIEIINLILQMFVGFAHMYIYFFDHNIYHTILITILIYNFYILIISYIVDKLVDSTKSLSDFLKKNIV